MAVDLLIKVRTQRSGSEKSVPSAVAIEEKWTERQLIKTDMETKK